MKVPGDQELLALLVSGDPRLAKRGLQLICDAIEAGRRVDLTRDPRLFTAISMLKGTNDVLVRRWLYKLIGLLNIRQLVPWLEGQLHGREEDPENITWAVGALIGISGLSTVNRKLMRAGLDPTNPAFILAGDYFRSGPPVDSSILAKTLEHDDPVAHKWLSMRFGKDGSALPRDVLPDLATSNNATVVEYSIWALHRDPGGRLADLSIFPQDIDTLPPNVRRWFLRLLVKEPANLTPYADIVSHAMSDPDQLVREGLAIGLLNAPFNEVLAENIANWFIREPDPLVRLALARALSARRQRFPYFNELLTQEREASGSLAARILPQPPSRKAAKIFVPSPRKYRRSSSLFKPVPEITSNIQEDAYLLGIDTVKFSEHTDRQQYAIFRDLLDALSNEDLVVREDPENLVVLLTGDGAFIAFRGSRSRLSPLRLAVSLQRSFHALRAYKLRFGVNSGPATWIFFKQSSPQLISHAVNWTARVMSAAQGEQILLSDHYYRQYVQPARDELGGISYRVLTGLKTKHDDEIPAWEALANL
jgi:class 3 adenylate cyclase